MTYFESVQELLEAKEGEHVQFKEAKNRFDFGEAAKCCCALANLLTTQTGSLLS